jgi:hypothetical protein
MPSGNTSKCFTELFHQAQDLGALENTNGFAFGVIATQFVIRNCGKGQEDSSLETSGYS